MSDLKEFVEDAFGEFVESPLRERGPGYGPCPAYKGPRDKYGSGFVGLVNSFDVSISLSPGGTLMPAFGLAPPYIIPTVTVSGGRLLVTPLVELVGPMQVPLLNEGRLGALVATPALHPGVYAGKMKLTRDSENGMCQEYNPWLGNPPNLSREPPPVDSIFPHSDITSGLVQGNTIADLNDYVGSQFPFNWGLSGDFRTGSGDYNPRFGVIGFRDWSNRRCPEDRVLKLTHWPDEEFFVTLGPPCPFRIFINIGGQLSTLTVDEIAQEHGFTGPDDPAWQYQEAELRSPIQLQGGFTFELSGLRIF